MSRLELVCVATTTLAALASFAMLALGALAPL
jgi:hypothetical protein